MPIHVLSSAPHPLSATFDTQLATCRLEDGRVARALVKTGGAHPMNPTSAWGGVPYEALVYREALTGVEGVPQMYGALEDGGRTLLVLEHIEDAVPVHRAHEDALVLAASWIGRFHRRWEGVPPPPAIERLGARWYTAAARRARNAVARDSASRPLVDAAAATLTSCRALFDRPPVVVHGDLYADNILTDGRRVTVVDWGWAAWGTGEVDLAALIERWPAPISGRCIDAYVDARWRGAPPSDFDDALRAARLHLLLRWIGHSPTWAADPKRAWRYHALEQFLEHG